MARRTALGSRIWLAQGPRRQLARLLQIAHNDVMSEITRILTDAADGDPNAAEKLLPLVYDELRKLAAAKLAKEKPGQTLQATSLVHEAYLRLVEREPAAKWEGKAHFFAAAAEAMRRILVDRARSKQRQKHGGDMTRQPLAEDSIVVPQIEGDLLELDAALQKLEEKDKRKAELVKLRYFVGMTSKQAAQVLDISLATADRDWSYARAWLYREIASEPDV